jgi:hypothetical protein
MAFLALVPAGNAGAAQVGRWEGAGPDGFRVSFQVMQVPGSARRAASFLAISCPYQGELNLQYAAETRDGFIEPGDTRRPWAFPIRRSGRLKQPTLGGKSFYGTPAIQGKLDDGSGRVKVLHGSSCDGGFGQDVRLEVHRVSGAMPASGVWKLGPQPSELRFEVFGTALQYFNGHLFTGMGVYQGVPYPCIGPLVANLPGWINPDGSFAVSIANPPPTTEIKGSFASATTASGSYVHSVPVNTALFRCKDLPVPFTAELEEAIPPPRVGGRELEDDPGPEPPPTPPFPSPTEPTDYVALGDSYSSGEGVPPFDPETTTKTDRCHRSTRAYSRVFAPPGYQLNRTFLACSGAITDNVGRLDPSGALTGTPQGHDDSRLVQLGRLDSAAWQATDLVTITIGGNDSQFAGVLGQCVFLPCHKGKRAERIKARIANEVPPLLAGTYGAIRQTATSAGVVTLGYPQLFPNDPRDRCPFGKRVVTRAKQVFLRERGEQLNSVVRRQAAAAGFHFVDVERAFAGHEPCGKKKEWIHGLVLGLGRGGGKAVYSFHPNRKGQRAYAKTMRRYFSCLYRNGFPFDAAGVPAAPTPAQPVPGACR